jgi:glycosyltransferase involved in cell wall biosynthesis
MNVLIAVPWFTPGAVGGVGLSVQLAAQRLSGRGHKVNVLIHGDSQTTKHIADDGAVPIHSLYLRQPDTTRRWLRFSTAFVLYAPRTLRELRRFTRKEKIDVICIYYPGLSHIYYRLLKMFWGTKYVVSPRGSDINIEARRSWMATAVVRSLIRNADGLIPCSARMRQATSELCRGKIPKRTEVIYTGIETGWDDTNGTSAYDSERAFILTLAWSTPVKGPDIVMRAFDRIADSYPDIDLVMVGGGPQNDEMNGLRDTLGRTDRIIRLGTVGHDTLPPLFKRARFGVIPSRNEGFPKVTLEFGWMRKAVVATKVGGIPEVVRDGETGLLVDSEDVDGMAEKMKYLLENPDESDRMGTAARRLVEERFTAERTADQLEQFLMGVVESR